VSPTRKDLIANARILIVDDEYTNVSLMERILKTGGYRNIASITESRQVIDQFRIFRPDLVMLDIAMPRVDGFEVMAQLRGWIPEDTYLPILVLTSDNSRSTRQKALTQGATDFLTKPVDADEVLLRLYNLLQTQWLYRQVQSQNRNLMEQVRASQQELEAAKTHYPRAGRSDDSD
jgi:PleD family two-component response regulator